MALDADQLRAIAAFLDGSRFHTAGAVVTDLDGTAVHEREGRTVIAERVEFALKHLRDTGRPVVINTLRFPWSVIRTFGEAWYTITSAPIPLVSLNGSQIGHIVQEPGGTLGFKEEQAFPLERADLEELLQGVEGAVANGSDDLLVFHYPRDWRKGEIIWTAREERIPRIAAKFSSAEEVISGGVAALRARLLGQDVCMMFVVEEAPVDKLMAYQHTRPSSFVTRTGVDKLFGAHRMAERLGFDLAHSVGAGDTPMDTFLDGVGLALQVGSLPLSFRGKADTLRLGTSNDLGDALYALADLRR